MFEGGGVPFYRGGVHLCRGGASAEGPPPLQERKQGPPFYREKLQVKLTFSTANHVKEKT